MGLELGAEADVHDQREGGIGGIGGIGQIGSPRSICLGLFPLSIPFPLSGRWSRANQEHKVNYTFL